MGVGNEISQQQINQKAGLLATQLRDWALQAKNLHTTIGALAGDDPGRANAIAAMGTTMSAADTTQIVYLINVLNTVAAIYYGTAGQTPPFNFDNALSPLWGLA